MGTVHATPALLPGPPGTATLVIATWEGEVHAIGLEVQNGRAALAGEDAIRWTYDVEDEVWASPALTALDLPPDSGAAPDASAAPGGVVVVAGWGGKVRGLRLADGEDLWERTLDGRVTASPVISAGLVFLATEGGELLALDVRNGEVRWTCRERSGVQATPLAASGTLYVAFMDGTLRAYRNAHPEWRSEQEG